MARPKADATRIKELEVEVADLSEQLRLSRCRNAEMSGLFYDMHYILCDIHSSQDVSYETTPYIHALMLMAERGTES
jgi:hypothetical protein